MRLRDLFDAALFIGLMGILIVVMLSGPNHW